MECDKQWRIQDFIWVGGGLGARTSPAIASELPPEMHINYRHSVISGGLEPLAQGVLSPLSPLYPLLVTRSQDPASFGIYGGKVSCQQEGEN